MAYFVFMVGFATYSTISAVSTVITSVINKSYCYVPPQIVDFYPNRPQKVSVLQEQETVMPYPKLTICSPAFFNKER